MLANESTTPATSHLPYFPAGKNSEYFPFSFPRRGDCLCFLTPMQDKLVHGMHVEKCFQRPTNNIKMRKNCPSKFVLEKYQRMCVFSYSAY